MYGIIGFVEFDQLPQGPDFEKRQKAWMTRRVEVINRQLHSRLSTGSPEKLNDSISRDMRQFRVLFANADRSPWISTLTTLFPALTTSPVK